jgi:hypothetical protein
LPEKPIVDQIQNGSEPDEYPEDILISVQSTVQYNLGKLDGKGFINRFSEEGKKEKRIEFQRGGEVYTATQKFDDHWVGNAFENLASSLEDAID